MTPGQISAITAAGSNELVHQAEVQQILCLDNIELEALISEGKFPPAHTTNDAGSFWLRKEVVYMHGGLKAYKSDLAEMVSIVLDAR